MLIADASSESGFGLGSVRLTVTNADVDQTPLVAADDLIIQLQTDGASIEPSEIKIPAGSARATVEVRSRGVGLVKVRAVGDLRSDPVDIHFVFPWSFLITTMLGGAVGGYLSSMRAKIRTPRHRSKFVQAMVEGAIVGVLIVISLLVLPGVAGMIPEAARTSVIGWLLASALAGFVGSELIERLANRVFGRGQQRQPPANDAQTNEAARQSHR